MASDRDLAHVIDVLKAGGVITPLIGNLGRDPQGRYININASLADRLAAVQQRRSAARRRTTKQPRQATPPTDEAAIRAKAQAVLGEAIGTEHADALILLTDRGAITDADLSDDQRTALAEAGLIERLAGGELVPTPAARLLMAAARQGNVAKVAEYRARAKAAVIERERVKAEEERKKTEKEAEQERRQAERGGGGSGRGQRPSSPTAVLQDAGLDPDTASALDALANGDAVDEEYTQALIERGLAQRRDDGVTELTIIGRQVVRAADRGDTDRVRRLLAQRSGQKHMHDDGDDVFIDEVAIKAGPEDDLSDDERNLYRALRQALAAIGELIDPTADPPLTPEQVAEQLYPAVRGKLVDIAEQRVQVLSDEFRISTDPARMSALLYDWEMTYTQTLISKQLSPYTIAVVQQAVAQWRATPGADRDVLVKMITPVTGPKRAETIAITAATEASTAGVRAYRDMLREEYGLEYEMVWYTAADERVCPLCGALHQKRERDWNGRNGPPAHIRCRCGVGLVRKRP